MGFDETAFSASAEHERLEQAKRGEPWKTWGPYLSERQWGTVREDHSDSGDAWNAETMVETSLELAANDPTYEELAVPSDRVDRGDRAPRAPLCDDDACAGPRGQGARPGGPAGGGSRLTHQSVLCLTT